VAPTPQTDAAITERMQALHALLARWSTERSTEVEAFEPAAARRRTLTHTLAHTLAHAFTEAR
jgi:hypothetical protein